MDKEPTVGGVRVTNRNEFTIKDMFDGVPYTFEAGKALTVSPEAVAHMFGWREIVSDDDSPEAVAADMLLYCQKRHGWNTPDVIRAGKDREYFGNLEFKAVRFRMVEVADDEEALPTMTAPQRRVNKLMAAADDAEARNAEPRR